jgi:regulatory protein
VKGRAINLLARREHSRAELQSKLKKQGCDAEELTRVLDECTAEGWQDDARFAEMYAQRRAERGYGPFFIRHELEQRGVNTEAVVAALAPLASVWMEQLQGLIQKRCRDGILTDSKQRSSLMRFLQARGFSQEQIVRALTRRDTD